MGGQHAGVLLSGSLPIIFTHIFRHSHVLVFIANKLCCCCFKQQRWELVVHAVSVARADSCYLTSPTDAKPARQDADEIMTSFGCSVGDDDDCSGDGRIKGDWATTGEIAPSTPPPAGSAAVSCCAITADNTRPAVTAATPSEIGLAFNPSNNLRTNADRGSPDVSRL